MAVSQTTANKAGISNISQADSDGYYYTPFADVRIYVGTGSPHTIITAPIGSLFIERGSGVLYINTNAGTTWAVVGTQT